MPIFRASSSDAKARVNHNALGSALAVVGLLAASVLVLGCGKAGPPVPPEPRSPLPPTEVTAAQNGPIVRVRGRIAPPRGPRSSQLPVRVELWRADLISDLADENDLESFRRMGRLVQAIDGGPLVSGRFYELVDPLQLEVASRSLKTKYRYALRVIDKRGPPNAVGRNARA